MIDRNRALTSEDLIRRYDLESLKTNRKAIQMNKQGLDKTESILNQFILSVLKGISNTEDQVDGKVTTWFYNYAPTTSNEPASNWTTDADKNSHLGDLFYDKNTGHVYMYDIVSETYTWVRQTNDSIVQAMAIANSNPDTSDGYRDIFVIEPTTPYKAGDIWFKEDGTIYRCNIARASGDFNDAEWIISTQYSSDDYVNDAKAIINDFRETITTNYICKVLVKSTRDSIELSVSSITQKLESDYSTTAEMYSAINLNAEGVLSVVSNNYSTKVETNTAKNDAINTANGDTDTKLADYSTTTVMNNAITQAITDNNSNYVAIELNKKVNNEDVTGAFLVLKINGDSSSGKLNADKVDITANDVLNLLAGNTINLTSKNIEIHSTNFSLDVAGNIDAKSGKIGGYNITNNSLYAENYAKHNYTQADLSLIYQYITGHTTLTDEQIKYFDVNNDGRVTSLDYVIIYKMIKYGVTTNNPTVIAMNSGVNGLDSSYEIIDGNGETKLKISISGIQAEEVSTETISAGNIDCGTCTLNSNSNVSVSFNKTFAGVPSVVLTPNTTVSGVIAPKIREVTTTGFKAIIGGSVSGNINCDWIAIY